ncbi:MAG TPA: 6-phosphogluconolactonase [Gemmatimonadaceae bacterium]|nr:6-phosphogluconolactonase [Gemmatimonadaceae bacterium]
MSIHDERRSVAGGVMRPERVVVRDGALFVDAAAAWIADTIAAVLAERERCSIALAGGRTPRAIYEHLVDRYVNVPWPLLDIYFGDERRVPPDDPASNFRMAYDALLSRVPIEPERVHRMPGEREDADRAAREYEAVLPASLDVVLLGLGADGHTASLFPGAPELHERERRVLPSTSPVPPVGRLTITPPVIAAATHVAIMTAGSSKAAAVARALEGRFDPFTLPVQFALRGSWILDRDAAALLRVVPA